MAPELRKVMLRCPCCMVRPRSWTGWRRYGRYPVSGSIDELTEVCDHLAAYGIQDDVVIDLGILRGLITIPVSFLKGILPSWVTRCWEAVVMITCSTNSAVPGLLPGLPSAREGPPGSEGSQLHAPQVYEVSGKDAGAVLAKARELREQGLIVTADPINQGGDGQVVVKRRAGAED